MPIKKAAIKALRQDKKRTVINNKIKSDVSALVRKVKKSISSDDTSKTADWLKQASKKIDKAVQKGVLKKNTAARKKSRLTKAVNKIIKK
jgi:small subunit ribosomal protein S20